jgi:hypothetical protein
VVEALCEYLRSKREDTERVDVLVQVVPKWEVAVLPQIRIDITDLASLTSYWLIQRSSTSWFKP